MTDAELQEVADAMYPHHIWDGFDYEAAAVDVYPIIRRQVLLHVCRTLEERAQQAQDKDSKNKSWAALRDASWAIGHPDE